MRFVLSMLAIAALASSTDAVADPAPSAALTDPSRATEKAPDTFRARFETTKGDIVFDCTRDWAPNGVDRFYNLVKIGFFDEVTFFRVVAGFVVQWGIHGDPKVAAAWSNANLPPDPPKQSNTRGMLTYAMAGRPDTRSTQLFINYGNNANLDAMGFAPICKVTEGMDVAEKLYGGYGERVTGMQGEITAEGNAYLKRAWPELDHIKTATIVGDTPRAPSAETNKPEEGDHTGAFVIGAIVVGGVAWFAFTRKSEPEKPVEKKPAAGREEAAPRKKKKKKRPPEA